MMLVVTLFKQEYLKADLNGGLRGFEKHYFTGSEP